MFIKLSAWEEGYAAALIKLGWDPNKVRQLIAQNKAGVAAAHAKTVQRASFGDKKLPGIKDTMANRPDSHLPSALIGHGVGSTRLHPITKQPIHSQVEQDVLKNLGYSRSQAYAPPKVPAAAKPSETRTALMAAGF